jgi:SAM-dependent methyltransferase
MDSRLRGEINAIWNEVLDYECDLVVSATTSKDGKCLRFVDVGCGSLGLLGSKNERLAAFRAHSTGIDIDSEALARNTSVQNRICASCYSLPLKDSSVDVIVCRWVFEHLETPERAFQEFARVLKVGGIAYIKTPNLWNYTMILSRATSASLHNAFRSATGQHENTPTFYRANTKRKLTKLAKNSGFIVRRLESRSYSYMYYAFNKELFHFMRNVSRLVGKMTGFMEQSLFCVLEKSQETLP